MEAGKAFHILVVRIRNVASLSDVNNEKLPKSIYQPKFKSESFNGKSEREFFKKIIFKILFTLQSCIHNFK